MQGQKSTSLFAVLILTPLSSPPPQNKLMKGFSNQLIQKHHYIKYLLEENEYSGASLEKVKSEFDKLISLQQFLSVSGLQQSSTKVCM